MQQREPPRHICPWGGCRGASAVLSPLQATAVFWTGGVCREVQAAASRFPAVPDSAVRIPKATAAAGSAAGWAQTSPPRAAALSSTGWWLPSSRARPQPSPGAGTTSAPLSAGEAEASRPCRARCPQHSSCAPPALTSPGMPGFEGSRGTAQGVWLFLPLPKAGAGAGGFQTAGRRLLATHSK